MAKNNRTIERIQAVWNILGGEEGVDRLIRGEITVCGPERAWREEGGVIYFSVTSDGATGEEWIKRLESKGFRLSNCAQRVLRSSDFKPTNGVITRIAVLKGILFGDNDLSTKKIRTEANKRGLVVPKAEVACLIREKFPKEEIEAMGLCWIVTMHEPIKDFDGDPRLLGSDHSGRGCWLSAYFDGPGIVWFREGGFAFVLKE